MDFNGPRPEQKYGLTQPLPTKRLFTGKASALTERDRVASYYSIVTR